MFRDFCSDIGEDNVISETGFYEFVKGSSTFFIVDVDSLGLKCFDSSEVVQRAKENIGKKNYNLVFNNCEHFAFWCKTGENIAYAELQKALFYCKRKKYLLLFISVRELIQDIRFYDLLDEYRVDFRCVDFPWFCRENLQLIKAVMLYEKLSS